MTAIVLDGLDESDTVDEGDGLLAVLAYDLINPPFATRIVTTSHSSQLATGGRGRE